MLLDSEDPESMKKHEAVLSEQKRMLVELMDMYYGQYGKGVDIVLVCFPADLFVPAVG